MMERKIIFKVMDFQGNVSNERVKLDFPEFKEETEPLSFTCKGEKVSIDCTVSVERQIMNYLDDMNKTELMDLNDWYIIIDYKVAPEPKPKISKEQQIVDFFSSTIKDESVLADIAITYKSLQPFIHKMPIEKQMLTVLASLNLTSAAVGHYVKHISSILFGKKKTLIQEGGLLINETNEESI